MSKLFVAYGSNLNLPQMARRCPAAEVVASGALRGYGLVFRGGADHGVANIERVTGAHREGTLLPVVVWSVNETDELALDRYEGFPVLYTKELVEVETAAGPVDAWAYIMTPGHPVAVPSAYYIGLILEGYASAGFAERPVLRAWRDARLQAAPRTLGRW